MRKQNASMEWLFHENDAEWERMQALLPLDITPALRRRLEVKCTLWCAATLLLLLAGTGGWWLYTTQAKLQTDEAELRTAVQQKPLALVRPDGSALVSTIQNEQTNDDGKSHDSGWEEYNREGGSLPVPVYMDHPIVPQEVVVQSMELLGNQAIANVSLNDQSGKPAYRQTRFYQHTAQGWLPTPPDATLWGAGSSLQTPHFVYYFRQRDAAVVQAAAPQIDAFYATLWRNFGLPISPTPEQLIINVSVAQPPGEAVLRGKMEPRLLVTSPALYLAPADLTDADLLVQSLAFPLLDHVIAQARHHHTLDESWQPLLDGLYVWQLWDASLPVADWHEEVVQWLYNDLPTNRPANQLGQPVGLPQHYRQLCARHKLWMKSPVQVHLPLICDGQDWEARYWQTKYIAFPLTHLKQLAAPVSMPMVAHQSPGYHSGQAVALATLIKYAVVTYGRDRLPVLLAALGDYDSWQTLLPAVYGVSAAEFEAGWQAYLAAHYGVTEEHS